MSASQSKSSSKTTTTNTDNRVVADANAVVINSGSSLTYTDEFPEQLKTFVSDVLTGAEHIVNSSVGTVSKSLDAITKANDSLGARLTEIEQGGTKQFIGIAALSVVVIIGIFAMKRGKLSI